jgi:rhodanese-related sulfurtransferase
MNRTRVVQVLLGVTLLILVGFLAFNLMSPMAIYPADAKDKLKKGEFDAVVDVRTDAEWSLGHVPLAIHIPVATLKTDLPQRIPDKSSRILFYCNTTTRARVAADLAKSLGYTNSRYLVGTHSNLL